MAVPKIKSEKEVTKFLEMNALDAQRTNEETNLSQPNKRIIHRILELVCMQTLTALQTRA